MNTQDVLDQIDHALVGDTSKDAMRWTPDAESHPTAAHRQPASEAFVRLSATAEQLRAAMRDAGRRLGEIVHRHGRTFHLVGVAHLQPRERRRHIARCGLCNPRANPARLCIDGHAYQRRAKARRRRRR